MKDKPATRRGILSIVSSVFDPLGMAASAVLTAKIKLQDLCKQKLGLDEEIPGKLKKRWEKWSKDLPQLEENYFVERCLKPDDFGKLVTTQHHHLSGASELGYCNRRSSPLYFTDG
ncbi:uncharacterized protein [Ptychodera flava]|uniref:uncharacterized protein n=1 Tax=Ptychodera flava TaxID=63121 RepID=UPI00396AAD4F